MKRNSLPDTAVLADIETGLTSFETGVDWVSAVCKNFTVEVNPIGNTLDYRDGGLSYFSVVGMYVGSAIEQGVNLLDDWHGSNVGDFDDLSSTSEPTSLMLPTLGGLAPTHRR